MVSKFFKSLKKVDNLTYKLIKSGLNFCLIIATLSATILILYSIFNYSQTIFYIGITMLKLSCNLGVEFIVCGLAIDTIKKELN